MIEKRERGRVIEKGERGRMIEKRGGRMIEGKREGETFSCPDFFLISCEILI